MAPAALSIVSRLHPAISSDKDAARRDAARAEILPASRLTRGRCTASYARHKAASPHKRLVVMQTEVVLHPKDGGLQLRIARAYSRAMYFCHSPHSGQSTASLHFPPHPPWSESSAPAAAFLPRSACMTLCHWLTDIVTPFFGQQRADFAHHCKIHVLLVQSSIWPVLISSTLANTARRRYPPRPHSAAAPGSPRHR